MKTFFISIMALCVFMCGEAQAVTLSSYAQVAFVEVPTIDVEELLDAARNFNGMGHFSGNAWAQSAYQQVDASVLAANASDPHSVFEIMLACN